MGSERTVNCQRLSEPPHPGAPGAYTHHGTDRALITALSCIDNMTPHALITWMIMH